MRLARVDGWLGYVLRLFEMKRSIAIVVVGRIKSSIPPKKDVFSFIIVALLIISLFGSVVVSNVSAVDINETDLSDTTDDVSFVETDSDCNISLCSDLISTTMANETNVSEIELGTIHTAQSGWGIETVDSTGKVGRDTSIALDSNGYPHISYSDNTIAI